MANDPTPKARTSKGKNSSSNNNNSTTSTRSSSNDGNALLGGNGSITIHGFILLVGLGLIFSGRYSIGAGFIVVGLTGAVCASPMVEAEDKLLIQFRIWSAVDILMELERLENRCEDPTEQKLHLQKALEVLVEKVSAEKQRQKDKDLHDAALAAAKKKNNTNNGGADTGEGPSSSSSSSSQPYFPIPPSPAQYRPHELESICQDAVYCAYRLFPTDPDVLLNAFGLHALVAKDTQVRKRHLYEADMYGLNKPIECMTVTLNQAKDINEPQEEQKFAEIQRKGSLLLGALSDSNTDMTRQLGSEGALQALCKTLDWYRYHEDCCNWALWAVFVLCYDNQTNNQMILHREANGVAVVCQTIRCNDESLEVARHGIAILFDMMRHKDADSRGDGGGGTADPALLAQIRQVAIREGLHRALLSAMEFFPGSMEIMGMGTEILVATGYQGDVPQYQPSPTALS